MISKLTTIIAVLIFSFSNIFAQQEVKSTGIGLRGSFWKLSNQSTQIIVSEYGENATLNIGGAGVGIYLFSRMDNNLFIEFSLGLIGGVEGESTSYMNENVDVFAVAPLLLGLRYNLLSPLNQSALQPYISFGGGPYWMTYIKVRDEIYGEEVTIKTDLKRGAYAGGGFNFILTSWLAANFDMKYHFINFNVKNEHSGFEYGLGINFMWGRYKLQR
ncbi:MAG: hypothetical protein JSW07_06935 [bacterium]|nr:MAG: hypothetical protein JSW07_06935 [bacterium]